MLNADYWFHPAPGPMTARAGVFYAVYAVVFLGCLVWSVWRFRQPSPPNRQILSRFEFVIGLAGLMLVGARLTQMPGWSARIWPLLMVGLAVSGPIAGYWAHRPACPFDHSLKLLALREAGPPLPLRGQLVLWTLHLAGLTVWVRVAGWPLWWAVVLWVALLVMQLLVATVITQRNPQTSITRQLGIYVTPLMPLFLAYASGGLHLLLDPQRYPFLMPSYPGLADLWWLPFYFESVSIAAMLYTLLVDLFLLNQRYLLDKLGSDLPDRRGFRNLCGLYPKFLRRYNQSTNRLANVGQTLEAARLAHRRWPFTLYILSCVLIVSSLAWMAFELFKHRTHGVTGTDSYGYTQVAVDLATRGTVLHRFELFSHIVDLPLAWVPAIGVGYHLPLNEMGDVASIWPLGMSILMAGGYRLWGEPGLYVTTPVVSLLAALVVGWLAVEMKKAARLGQSTVSRPGIFVAGSFALFVWATSFEVIDRSLVPLADAAAALFTALVWIALLKLRTSKPEGFQKPFGVYTSLSALAAGIALGLAFDVRYTQLLLVASAGVGIGGLIKASRRQRAWLLIIAGVGALIAALPDIVYRWHVFDSPLANPQARELTHFAPANIIPTLNSMAQQLFLEPEFGLVAPFLIAGLIWQWRRDQHGFVTLAAGALAMLVLQLPYEALRLRDLLPLYPLLAAWTGIGMAWMWRILANAPLQTETMPPRFINMLIVCAIFLALLLPTVRVEPLVTRTWQPHRASFGYVTARERAALNRLAILTPDPAAIGSHLNGGAIALHNQRWPFYPGGWTEKEFDCFLARMAADGIPVFLLDDGPSVRPVIKRLDAAGRLRRIARLDVPLPDDGSSGQLYEVLSGETGLEFSP